MQHRPAGTVVRSLASLRRPSRPLWVPTWKTEDVGTPRASASQILEMLVMYELIEDAWIDGAGFTVVENGKRFLLPHEVIDEYADLVGKMASAVMERSGKTTTQVSVPVGAAGGPVPYVLDVGDRVVEYSRYWRT